MSWSVFDGGARYGRRAEALARQEVAEQATTRTRRNAEVDVRRSSRGVQVAMENVEGAQRSRALAIEAERLARAAFLGGAATSLDITLAAAALRQAERLVIAQGAELSRARTNAAVSLARCDW